MCNGTYTAFEACGFNDEPFGILMTPQLRPYIKPASQFCHDWMHGIVASGGVFQIVTGLVLQECRAKVPDIFNMLNGYLQWLCRLPPSPHLC